MILENERAFLKLIQWAEGTDQAPDPYRVCYGYRHTISNLSEHPASRGEWAGELVVDEMRRKAGLGPGCKSTAAGAYQLLRPTWQRVRDRLSHRNFEQGGQDRAALYLI